MSGDLKGYTEVAAFEELRDKGRIVVKRDGKQVALFNSEKGVFACNNRCPHEGYPLVEGTLTGGCVLTCNWHNWKFDLDGGETLVGGDVLRLYPAVVRDGSIWLDLSDPPAEEVTAKALQSLRASFDDMDYGRMAREIARLQKSGADPNDALRAALGWTHDRFEFGTTHAHAAAADWLTLAERHAKDPAMRLVPVVEAVAHLAWDSLREPAYPFAEEVGEWGSDRFVDAVEQEDEDAAVVMARGAIAGGACYADLEPALARAALAHYGDFGHSAIYVYKVGALAARLGPDALEPLLLPLVRSLVYARREDLIPEFRSYADELAAWDGKGAKLPRHEDFVGLGVKRAMTRVHESSAHPNALHGALLAAGAFNLLRFNVDLQDKTDKPVSQNASWLDFTHAITFGNAVHVLCRRYPDLWPRALLQMACFVGRNTGFVDADQNVEEWSVDDADAFFEAEFLRLFDHGEFEYIVACHRLKTLEAAREEVAIRPETPEASMLSAGVNRYLGGPFKRKHTLRTARQSLAFVAAEG